MGETFNRRETEFTVMKHDGNKTVPSPVLSSAEVYTVLRPDREVSNSRSGFWTNVAPLTY